jgi:hypothetical protein
MQMDLKSKLSTLWIFVSLNSAYVDITTLYDNVFLGITRKVPYSQGFLLFGAVLVEVPISMVLLSRVLKYRPNRWANIIAGTFTTGVQIVSLFVGTPTMYYLFFSAILIPSTVVIVWYAWKWPETEA